MPALDLALGLGVMRRTTHMIHAFVIEPFGKIGRDVTRSVIAEQARFVDDTGIVRAHEASKFYPMGRYVGTLRSRNKIEIWDAARPPEVSPIGMALRRAAYYPQAAIPRRGTMAEAGEIIECTAYISRDANGTLVADNSGCNFVLRVKASS